MSLPTSTHSAASGAIATCAAQLVRRSGRRKAERERVSKASREAPASEEKGLDRRGGESWGENRGVESRARIACCWGFFLTPAPPRSLFPALASTGRACTGKNNGEVPNIPHRSQASYPLSMRNRPNEFRGPGNPSYTPPKLQLAARTMGGKRATKAEGITTEIYATDGKDQVSAYG